MQPCLQCIGHGKSYSRNQVDGLSLEPAIANIDVFQSVIEFADEKAAVEISLVNKIKDCKKTIRNYLHLFDFTDVDLALFEAPLPQDHNLIRLSNRLDALKDVVSKITEGKLIQNDSDVKNTKNEPKMSAMEDINVRCQ